MSLARGIRTAVLSRDTHCSCDDGPLFPHSDPRVPQVPHQIAPGCTRDCAASKSLRCTQAIKEIENGEVPRLFYDVMGRDPMVSFGQSFLQALAKTLCIACALHRD